MDSDDSERIREWLSSCNTPLRKTPSGEDVKEESAPKRAKHANEDTHSGGRSPKWAKEIYDDASTLRVSFPTSRSGSKESSQQRAGPLPTRSMFTSAKLNGTFEHAGSHVTRLPDRAYGMEQALLDIQHDSFRHSDWEGVPDNQAATEIWKKASELDNNMDYQSAWTREVHLKVLQIAVDLMPALDVQFNVRELDETWADRSFLKNGQSPCRLDFGITIKPTTTEDADAIEDLYVDRSRGARVPSVNFLRSWTDVRTEPIVLNVVTRGSGDATGVGRFHLGVGMASQWRNLARTASSENPSVEGLEVLYGILIQGHDWYMYRLLVSSEEGVAPKLLVPASFLGHTRTGQDIFKLFRSLRCLLEWGRDVYWPVFKKELLLQKEEAKPAVVKSEDEN